MSHLLHPSRHSGRALAWTRRAVALAALALAPTVAAQPFTSDVRETPIGAPDLARRATGGAVAALPTMESPFSSNPAHITTRGFTLNVLGATVGVGGNPRESYDFYDQQLGPAIERGLDTLPNDSLAMLYRDAIAIGSESKTADLAVLAPSVRFLAGPVGIGISAYARATSRARLVDGGAGIPQIDAYGQGDVAVPVVVGLDVGQVTDALPFGLSVGARATYLQRRVTAKSAPVDALDPDNEKVYVLLGKTVRMGVGLYATDVAVPGLDLGAELSNIGGAVGYEFDRSITIEGNGADDAAEIARLRERFDGRQPDAVVRVGAAYRLPVDLMPGLSGAAVGLDYTSATTADLDQSFQAGLRGGARIRVAGVLDLRAGFSQGMPSAGIGLGTRVTRLEYATYGVEDGRLLGQAQRRNHVVQIRLGWL